jgi:hypothetical protein
MHGILRSQRPGDGAPKRSSLQGIVGPDQAESGAGNGQHHQNKVRRQAVARLGMYVAGFALNELL